MQKHLLGLRQTVFQRADWAPTSSADAIARVNTWVNDAVAEFAHEAPFALYEDEVRLITQADFNPTLTTDKVIGVVVSSVLDQWVLKRDITRVAAAGYEWAVDGSWDGCRRVQVTLSDGTRRDFRIREVYEGNGQNNTSSEYEYMTLEEPLDIPSFTTGGGGTAVAVSYRIYTPVYYLPSDVISINAVRLTSPDARWELRPTSYDEASRIGYLEAPDQVADGVPSVFWRMPSVALPSPVDAPVVATTNGPSPPHWTVEGGGTFEYCSTYCWGYRDLQTGGGGPMVGGAPTRLPLFESMPSPVSDEITNDDAAVVITMHAPNPHDLLGFGTLAAGTGFADMPRLGHSGVYRRFYRRRKAIGATGPLLQLETSDRFYPLSLSESYQSEDMGESFADYQNPLKYSAAHAGIAVWPRPDKRYEIILRCIRVPDLLVDDRDAITVQEGAAATCIVDRALAYLYEAEGNHGAAQLAMKRYHEGVGVLRRRKGAVTENMVFQRGRARVVGRRSSGIIRRFTES